jgi:site-specific recombinase XerC
VDELSTSAIEAIVGEATHRHGRWTEASISTRFFRRSVFNYFFRTLHEHGLADANPAALLHLPRRPTTVGRPLTDDEMELCQDVAYYGIVPDTRPVALALAQAGAATGEIAAVHVGDLDLATGTVRLPGSTYTYERRNPLTPWGVRTLGDRVTHADSAEAPDRPLVVGLDVTAESATAMASTYLRDLLRLADITSSDVLPSSIRAWGARKAYEASGLEGAARFLGFESFDRTADIVGLDRRR